MAIHIRVVTPITTQGFRSPEDASQLESDGVKVDFVNIETGPASIECNYEIMLSQLGTIARVIEAEREDADAVVIDCMGDPRPVRRARLRQHPRARADADGDGYCGDDGSQVLASRRCSAASCR